MPGNAGGAEFEQKRETNQDVRGKPFWCRGEGVKRRAHFPLPRCRGFRFPSVPPDLPLCLGPWDSQVLRLSLGCGAQLRRRPRRSSRGAWASRAVLGAAIPRLTGSSCQPPQDPHWRSGTRLGEAPCEARVVRGANPGVRGAVFTPAVRVLSKVLRGYPFHRWLRTLRLQKDEIGRESDSDLSAPSRSL